MKEVFTPIDFSREREKEEAGLTETVKVWMYQTAEKKWERLSLKQGWAIDEGFKEIEGIMVYGEYEKNIELDDGERWCIKKLENGDLSAAYITKNNEYLEVGFYLVYWAWEERPILIGGGWLLGSWYEYPHNAAEIYEELLSQGESKVVDYFPSNVSAGLFDGFSVDDIAEIEVSKRIMTGLQTRKQYRMRRLCDPVLSQKYRENDKELHRIYEEESKHNELQIDGVAFDTYINNTISRDPNIYGYEGLGGFGFKRIAINPGIYRNFIAKKNEYENEEEHNTVLGFVAGKPENVDIFFKDSKYFEKLNGPLEKSVYVSLSPSHSHCVHKDIERKDGVTHPESSPFQMVPVLLTFKGIPVNSDAEILIGSENSTIKTDDVNQPEFYVIPEGCTCAAILPLGRFDYYKRNNSYYQELKKDRLSCEAMVEVVCKAPKLYNLWQEHAAGLRLKVLNTIMSFIEPSTKSDHLYLPSDSLMKKAEKIEKRCIQELSSRGIFSPNKTNEETQGPDSEPPQKRARLRY